MAGNTCFADVVRIIFRRKEDTGAELLESNNASFGWFRRTTIPTTRHAWLAKFKPEIGPQNNVQQKNLKIEQKIRFFFSPNLWKTENDQATEKVEIRQKEEESHACMIVTDFLTPHDPLSNLA